MRILLSAMALVTLAVPADAATRNFGISGFDRIRVDGQELQLNGLAVRTRFIFQVYVAGLYLPAKATLAKAAIRRMVPAVSAAAGTSIVTPGTSRPTRRTSSTNQWASSTSVTSGASTQTSAPVE